MPSIHVEIIFNSNDYNDYKNFYTNFSQIGEGAFGKIYKAKMIFGNTYRAIKIIDKEKIKNLLRNQLMKENIDNEFKLYFQHFLNEIEYMKIYVAKIILILSNYMNILILRKN